MESMSAFVDELVKIGKAGQIMKFLGQSVLPAAKQHAGTAAKVGAGGAGVLLGQRALANQQFAERARSQGYQI